MNEFPHIVPRNLVKAYEKRGITQLFDWQVECLSNERLFEPVFQNLIYTAPTSAGKTLVAEVVAACNVLKTGRRALFLFPYISSAREKLFDLQSLWRSVHLVAKGYIGASSSSLHGWSAAVCTIEKANTLINSFIEMDLLCEIGVIVIDEFHMIFDGERGGVIENIISKVLYSSMQTGNQIQIIGMSATLDEHKRLANWIGADVYVTNFRPLNLSEYAIIDGTIFDLINKVKVRTLSEEFRIKSDAKNLIGMTIEATLESKATLVFCQTKSDTEKYAIMLARYVHYCLAKGEENRFYKLGELLSLSQQHQIVEYFTQKTLCTDNDLLNCIATGIAFHHAGLTVEEREEIEFLFRNRNLKVLVSTSTLSSGVNLPAHRVLIMTSANSHIPLNSITYRQMVGRAGRKGQCSISGESYVLSSRADWPTIQSQIGRKQTPIVSRSTMRTILEAVNGEFVSTREGLEQLLSYSLSPPLNELEFELKQLNDLKLISIGSDSQCTKDITLFETQDESNVCEITRRIMPTQLGRAVLASSLSPSIALQIFTDLENATKSLCLDSELHMLYLNFFFWVTPINNLAINTSAIDWHFYHQTWAELSEPLTRVARRVGITEKFFMQKLGGRLFTKDNELLNLHIRFFATLILYELINENPIEKISQKFRINRGLLQSLQQQAAIYAYMVVAFCDRLGWYYLKILLEGFAERLQFGVRRDLTELVRVPGIDAVRARHFHQNNIKSLMVLANASVDQVCKVLRKAVPLSTNLNAVRDKNTWLFGEPPIEDFRAAQLLIERACDVLKEKLEFASMPSSIFAKNKFMEVTSTSFASSQWLSEDLTASELIHESAVNELCNTLSPLQLNNEINKNIPKSSISSYNDDDGIWTSPLANFEKTKTNNKILPIALSFTPRNNFVKNSPQSAAKPKSAKKSALRQSSKTPNKQLTKKVTNQKAFRATKPQSPLKECEVEHNNNNSGLLEIPNNENKESNNQLMVINETPESDYDSSTIRKVIIDESENENSPKTVKIELKSLDCAEIFVAGRPVKLRTHKKLFSERISKGITPLQSPCSPLHKKRSPLVELNTTTDTVKNTNIPITSDDLTDEDEGEIAEADSFDKFWESIDVTNAEKDKNETTTNAEGSGDKNASNLISDTDVLAVALFATVNLNQEDVDQNVKGLRANNLSPVSGSKDQPENVKHDAAVQSSNSFSESSEADQDNVEIIENDEENGKNTKQINQNVSPIPQNNNNITINKEIVNDRTKLTPTKGKNGIKFICRCTWSINSIFGEKDLPSTASCGLTQTDDFVLIFVEETHQCFLLPLRRVEGACRKCRTNDFDWLLAEILSNTSIRKWFPDALKFLRSVRHIFCRRECSINSPLLKAPVKRISDTTSRFSRRTFEPRNFGCIRTLEALTTGVRLPSEVENFTIDSIRTIAKRLGIAKWQPASKSVSWNTSLPSVILTVRTINAAIDAYFAAFIASKIVSESDERQQSLQHLYFESIETIASIELAGMEFSRSRCTKMIANLAVQMAETEKRVFRLCNGLKFNLDSPEEVSKILFVKLNLVAPENATCTRRHLSTSNSILKKLNHPAADAIAKWRTLNNSYSVLRGLLQEVAVQASNDSRIRTCFDNLGGMAGRITSNCPNLQFLPKEPLVHTKYSTRSVLIAPPGMILMAADYCQLELRVLCELSMDKELTKLLCDPSVGNSDFTDVSVESSLRSATSSVWDGTPDRSGDPFTKIARYFDAHQKESLASKRVKTAPNFIQAENLLSGSSESDDASAEMFRCDRQRAKQLCYAIIYGMGAETLGREMHISKADAQTLINKFFELFPKVKCWIEKCLEKCRECLFCETFMGRKRGFESAAVGETLANERRIGRQCINYTIQGTASEMFRQALINVHRRLREEFRPIKSDDMSTDMKLPRIVMQIHDEIIVEVAERDARKCAGILRDSMENVFASHGFHVNFPVKLSCGRSWGSLTQCYQF